MLLRLFDRRLEKAYGDVAVLCIETDYTKPVVISMAKADSC